MNIETSLASTKPDGPTWIGFSFCPRRTGIALACLITVIVTSGALANYMIYNVAPHPEHPLADVLKRFDLGHEPSIPAFYSATMMLCCAFVLASIGASAQQWRRSWFLLSLCLLAMAVDEAVMFHEMANAAVNLFMPTSGIFYFAWVIPAAAVILVFALVFVRFFFSLDRRTAACFALAAVLFVGGAVGMELVASVIFDAAASEEAALSSLSHVLSQAVEEGLEMVGMGVFFVSLLDYVRRHAVGFRFPYAASLQQSRNSGDDGASPGKAVVEPASGVTP